MEGFTCPLCGRSVVWIPVSGLMDNQPLPVGWWCPVHGHLAGTQAEGPRVSWPEKFQFRLARLLEIFFLRPAQRVLQELRRLGQGDAFAGLFVGISEVARLSASLFKGLIALAGLALVVAGLFGLNWAEITSLIQQWTGLVIKLAPPYDPFLVGLGLVFLARLLGRGRVL